MQPNLFSYATSELSQDAFLCWLLEWADEKYKTGSKKHQFLNTVSRELLEMFFEKCDLVLPSIIETEVYKQDGNIDVLCIINKEYCVLIEDKVGTIQHSEQLTRYKAYIEDKNIYQTNNIIPIYLQTRDQSNYKKVEKDGFKIVKRKDILSVLSKPESLEARELSDILNDYILHIEKIENAVNSFKHKTMDKWNKSAWIGYFLAIQEQFSNANWGYVANPSGGFMGLWCFTQYLENMDIYLQLEQEKICFKVAVDDNVNKSSIRNSLLKLFKEEAKNFNLDVTKPARFGNGTYMTFAILKDGFDLAKNNNGTLNIEESFLLLEKLAKYIEHCVNKLRCV